MTDRSPGDEAKFEVMVRNLKDYAIFSTDDDAIIDTWNVGAEHVFGYSAEEIVGQELDVIFTDEDRRAGVPARELESARQTGTAQDKRWHVRKDGNRFWADGHLMRVDGMPGFVKVVRDLTAEKLAEDSVRQSEEQFSRAFLSNPVPMAFVSSAGLFSTVNEAFFQLAGYWRPDLVGEAPETLELWTSLEGDPVDLQRIVEADGQGLRIRVHSKNGSSREMLAFARQTSSEDEATLLVLVNLETALGNGEAPGTRW